MDAEVSKYDYCLASAVKVLMVALLFPQMLEDTVIENDGEQSEQDLELSAEDYNQIVSEEELAECAIDKVCEEIKKHRCELIQIALALYEQGSITGEQALFYTGYYENQ